MSIKEELEKALSDELWPDGAEFKYDGYDMSDVVDKVAVFSAKWMAERIAKKADKSHAFLYSNEIRQLAKELE